MRIDPQIEARFQALAAQGDGDAESLLRKALVEFLDRREVHARERAEDEARWQEYKRTGVAYTQEEMEAWVEQLPGNA
jgi:predicted transcriptional regulator